MKKTILMTLLSAGMALFGKDADAQIGGDRMKVNCLGNKVTGVEFAFNHRDGAGALDDAAKPGSSVITYVVASKELKSVAFFTDAAWDMGVPAGLKADKVVDLTAPGHQAQKDFAGTLMGIAREGCSTNQGDLNTVYIPISPTSKVSKDAKNVIKTM